MASGDGIAAEKAGLTKTHRADGSVSFEQALSALKNFLRGSIGGFKDWEQGSRCAECHLRPSA